MEIRSIVLLTGFLVGSIRIVAADAPLGLTASVQAGGKTDTVVLPNVWFYQSVGQSATPFLVGETTSVEWNGYINADLRGDYKFKAQLSGTLKLEINDRVVLEGSGDGKKEIGPSAEVRLNKGPNKLKAVFAGIKSGESFVRLLWTEFGFLWEPIPRDALTHDAGNAALAKADKLRRGREIFLEGRCAKCHAPGELPNPIPELGMDAPAFAGIGSRRHARWMANRILDPKADLVGAQMPKLLHGETASSAAEAIAAYLATLTTDDKPLPEPTEAKNLEEGAHLVEVLNCAGCHDLPDTEKKDTTKISLNAVNEMFPPGRLAPFLANPTKHYAWRRMPNFRLSNGEAGAIAGYLRSRAPMVKMKAIPSDGHLIDAGKKLVQTKGCLNCHSLELPNQFTARSMAKLNPGKFGFGCLAGESDGKSPFFGFTAGELDALKLFAGADRKSLQRHAPTEFAEQQTRNLNCRACHGKLDGFPPIERLGEKLKPEWMTDLLAGRVEYKPRPWLEHRMPVFPTIARELADGLAQSHGYGPKTEKEGPVNVEMAKIGRKLVGVDGGFSCISCHAVGSLAPTQVFEAEGINLAYPAERLQKDFYLRWLLNPLRIQPQTKMPVYFDDQGNSPLFDVLEGNSLKQLDAFWQYMRTGQKIEPPAMQ